MKRTNVAGKDSNSMYPITSGRTAPAPKLRAGASTRTSKTHTRRSRAFPTHGAIAAFSLLSTSTSSFSPATANQSKRPCLWCRHFIERCTPVRLPDPTQPLTQPGFGQVNHRPNHRGVAVFAFNRQITESAPDRFACVRRRSRHVWLEVGSANHVRRFLTNSRGPRFWFIWST